MADRSIYKRLFYTTAAVTGFRESVFWRLLGGVFLSAGGVRPRRRRLLPVFVLERPRHFVAQLTVVGVDGRAQRGFRGTALRQEFQNTRDFPHAVGIANIFGRRQRFGIG